MLFRCWKNALWLGMIVPLSGNNCPSLGKNIFSSEKNFPWLWKNVLPLRKNISLAGKKCHLSWKNISSRMRNFHSQGNNDTLNSTIQFNCKLTVWISYSPRPPVLCLPTQSVTPHLIMRYPTLFGLVSFRADLRWEGSLPHWIRLN